MERPIRCPPRSGTCSDTTIAEIGYRLGDPDTGSAVSYANGGVQISYDTIPEIHRSKVGDGVKLCLVSLPEDCPPDDDRGKVYRATNLRTGEVLGSAQLAALLRRRLA